jgi:hypothetical protein
VFADFLLTVRRVAAAQSTRNQRGGCPAGRSPRLFRAKPDDVTPCWRELSTSTSGVVPQKKPVKCSGDLPVGDPPRATAAVCIHEEKEPFTFYVSAGIANRYGYNIGASIKLSFFPDYVDLGACHNLVVERGKVVTCASRRAFHRYPVAGEAYVNWYVHDPFEVGYRTIHSPEFNL